MLRQAVHHLGCLKMQPWLWKSPAAWVAESAKCCAVSVLWLPLRAYTFLIRSGGAQASASPLAESALLLLLALLHHAPAPELGPGNPFRQALANMQACASMWLPCST